MLLYIKNKIYLVSGDEGGPSPVYDSVTDTWEIKLRFYTRGGLELDVVDDKIHLTRGDLPRIFFIDTPSDVIGVYDPATDSWSIMTLTPTPVSGYLPAVLDDKKIGYRKSNFWKPRRSFFHTFKPLNRFQIFDLKQSSRRRAS